MKVGVISDTHDRIDLTKKVIKKLEDADCTALIHCGDFCAPFIIKELSEFKGDVYCCFGNTDDKFSSTRMADKLGVNLLGEIGEIELDGKKIFFNHFPNISRAFAMTGDYDIVFYGHTHIKHKEIIRDVPLVCPGSIMGNKEISSYVIYDTSNESIEFFDLE